MPSRLASVPIPRLLRYGLVGIVATATHFATLMICVEQALLPPWLASGLGAVVGAQMAYAGNRWFTFDHRGAMARSWPRFQFTALLGGLLGMAIVAAGVAAGLHYLFAQVVATFASLLLTFGINRAWTFR